MHENIRFRYKHFCIVDGRYYYINSDTNNCVVVSGSGKVLFSYPLSCIVSEPLKMKSSGKYFFTLHRVSGRNEIIKWRIVNFIFEKIDEYDLGNSGILSSKSTIFLKYFNVPIQNGGWEEIGEDDEAFVIYGNELKVDSYGTATGLKGPKIYKAVSSTTFSFSIKFIPEYIYGNDIITILFEGDQYDLVVSIEKLKISILSPLAYSHVVAISSGVYSSLDIFVSDSNLSIFLNDHEIHNEECDACVFSSSSVQVLNSVRSRQDNIRINNLKMFGYYYDDIIKTNAFIVDEYFSSVSSEVLPGDSTITILGPPIKTGTVLGICDSSYEEVVILDTVSSGVYSIEFPVVSQHLVGTKTWHSNNFYIFNDYTYTTQGGSLYVIDYTYNKVIDVISSSIYYGAQAACGLSYDNNYVVGFMHVTNFIYIDIMSYVIMDVMNVENVMSDGSTVIDVEDVGIVGDSVARLQQRANYYNEDIFWSEYNLQFTPIVKFVDSVTLGSEFSIMPADAISIVKVNLSANDQYANPLIYEKVMFSDDDNVGYMTIPENYTDTNGTCHSYYRSGTTPREVEIMAKVIQG